MQSIVSGHSNLLWPAVALWFMVSGCSHLLRPVDVLWCPSSSHGYLLWPANVLWSPASDCSYLLWSTDASQSSASGHSFFSRVGNDMWSMVCQCPKCLDTKIWTQHWLSIIRHSPWPSHLLCYQSHICSDQQWHLRVWAILHNGSL